MVRKTQIDALLCVPLYNHYGWEGMLLFGSRAGEYDPHQAELLERLGPVIATNLQRVV